MLPLFKSREVPVRFLPSHLAALDRRVQPRAGVSDADAPDRLVELIWFGCARSRAASVSVTRPDATILSRRWTIRSRLFGPVGFSKSSVRSNSYASRRLITREPTARATTA